MKRVGKPRLLGNMSHHDSGLLNLLRREVHFKPEEELVGGLRVVAVKQPAKVGGADVAFGGDLPKAPQSLEVAFDMLTALLVG